MSEPPPRSGEPIRQRRAAQRLPIADFHSHHIAPSVPALAPSGAPADLLRSWRRVRRQAGDLAGMLAEMDFLGIDLRVLSAPPAMVTPAGQRITPATVALVNEYLADVVAAHPGRLAGLATVDAFAGPAAVGAVAEVAAAGFPGIVVDCAHQGLLLDAPQCRPALESAAAAGLTVFVHPVSPVALSAELAPLGRLGTSLARGTASAACLLALLVAGMPERLPGLRLVFPMLGAAGLHLAAAAPAGERIAADAPVDQRWHLYTDTMGFAPASIRFAVELLGADHVVAGSDWPVADRVADRDRVSWALDRAGLTRTQQRWVAHDNAAALVGRSTPG